MKKQVFILIAFLCSLSILRAQAPIIICDTDGEISEVDLPNSCDKNLIVDVGISLSDITLHPNGKMYGTRFSQGTLVEIDLTQNSTFSTLVDFDDANPVGMTAASNGKIYVTEGGEEDTRLFEVDVTTNTFVVKGILANGSSGDLSWSNGELYNASGDNKLVRVDIDNPENSVVIGDFDTGGDETIFSLVTAYITCDSSITYGISNQTNQYFIIDLSDASLTTLCSGEQGDARIFGATSADEFSASETCSAEIDLDADNSSTATGADFTTVFGCATSMASVADSDVTITSPFSIDSIVISLVSGVLNGANEFITIGSTPNITSNNNAATLTATNNGTASLEDFETYLQELVYNNTAAPATLGDRVIEVIAYANGENSNSAFTTITFEGNANAGNDATLTLCGNDAPVNLFNSLGSSAQSGGTWSPALSSGGNTFDPTEDAAGTYTYTVSDGCVSDSATVDVTFASAPNAGSDNSIIISDENLVDLFSLLGSSAEFNGTWSPALNSGTGVFDPTIDAEGSYNYIVSNDCDSDTATVTVEIKTPSDCQFETLFVPSGFTPNNDGQNDVYYVNLQGSYDKLDFRIYNRWGEIVFETNDIAIGWDGNFNGDLQSTDAFGYFLQVECDEEVIQRKGSITVVR